MMSMYTSEHVTEFRKYFFEQMFHQCIHCVKAALSTVTSYKTSNDTGMRWNVILTSLPQKY